MDLPTAPLTADDTDTPAWTGYQDPASRIPQSLSPSVLITREQLAAHLTNPLAWRSLPDGRPLRLQAEGMEYILDDFGGYDSTELRSAHRVLYFATRTEADMRALWIPSLPQDPGAVETKALAVNFYGLQAEMGAWASATFDPGAYKEVIKLAFLLWTNVIERLPVSAEKKSPAPARRQASGSPISGTFAGSSPAEMQTPISTSSSAPTSASSAAPSSRGATGTPRRRSPKRKKRGA